MATFSHYIFISLPGMDVVNQPGGTISWTSASIRQQSSGMVNSGDDGLLDVGADSFLARENVFTGYTIGFEGETYAIFGRQSGGGGRQFGGGEAQYYIPYNLADANLAPLTAGGFTSVYTGNGAQVFNCFATGTTILTPDGEKAIETLQPGDRVVTHDGRSTPVIWVARQTVANPRGVELGRKPVRIDAGALGPDLPNRPLTVTADHALLFGDMLVNAGTLAEDGTPIRFLPLSEMPTRFVWWHVELENHEVVLANGGVPAESFIDYVGRSGFDNYDEYLEIAGADRLIKEMPFVRISARRLLPPNGLRGLPAIARRPLIAAPRKTAA